MSLGRAIYPLIACITLIGGCGAAERPEPQKEIWVNSEPAEHPCPAADNVRSLPESDLDTLKVVDIKQPTSIPCEIVAVPLGIELRAHPDGDSADPHPTFMPMATDAKGNYYTIAWQDPAVLVWNADGTFLRSIGSGGDGPGEFAGGGPSAIRVARNDSLFVLDRGGRWHIFDPTFEYVRTVASHPAGSHAVHVSKSGHFIYTKPLPGFAEDAAFHTLGTTGLSLGSSGNSLATSTGGIVKTRTSWLTASQHLWIAPRAGSDNGVVIESWALDGTPRMLVRRDAPWLPVRGYLDDSTMLDYHMPEYEALWVDEADRIWISMSVKQFPPLRSQRPTKAQIADFRIEVLDPHTRRVLASVKYDSIARDRPPPVLPISGAPGITFAPRFDTLGVPYLVLYQLHLVRR